MSKTKGLPFEMRQHIKRNYSNDDTRKCYRAHARYFCAFVKKQGYTANEVRTDPLRYLQAYTDSMVAEGVKSPDTIHTYLSYPCVFFCVSMKKLNKPPRTTPGITKSRGDGNEQGEREKEMEKNARLVNFEARVGIRRSEIARLNGTNFTQDENGYWCVEVTRGKGGKYHLERILREDVETIRSYFDGTKNRVFSRAEMNNKIDIHSMRSAKARRAYEYYAGLCVDPAQRAKVQQELIDRYCLYNKAYIQSGRDQKLLEAFVKDMQGTYKLRGGTVQIAREKGRPPVYDRTAVMAVSAFHLSHWRCGVAVRNYLLA